MRLANRLGTSKSFAGSHCKSFATPVENRLPIDCTNRCSVDFEGLRRLQIDQAVQRKFRPHGSISYDLRVLSWNMKKETVSIWRVDGRISLPFVCGEHHLELLGFQRGELISSIEIKNGFCLRRLTCQTRKRTRFLIGLA